MSLWGGGGEEFDNSLCHWDGKFDTIKIRNGRFEETATNNVYDYCTLVVTVEIEL